MGRDTFVTPKAPTAAERRNGPDVLGAIFADKGRSTMIAAATIRTDGGTQMRAGLDDATVFEYGQAMVAADGWGTFPPVVAYYDGSVYWLADGFHRVAAFLESFPDPKKQIPVDVRAGTKRDAVLHAAGANAEHGLRRTNADKRRAVEALLRDDEWKQWSLREIARCCAVSEGFVHKVSAELSVHGEQMRPTERTVTRGGTTYTQNTTNIGKPTPPPAKVVYTAPEPPAAVLNTAPAEHVTAKELFRAYQSGTPLDQLSATKAPAVITLDDLEVIASVTVPAAAPVAAPVDPDEEIDHPLDCYEENGAPAAGKMRDLWELKDWFARTRKDKVREYQKLTGRDVSIGFIGSLDFMIRNLEEAMDAFQAELEAKHVNQ